MQIEITRQEFIYYGAIAGATLGFLLGLAILILASRKGKTKLGVIGLICSTLGGAISGILAIIVTGIFIWLILKKPETETTNAASTETSDAFKSEVSDSGNSDSVH